MKVYLTVTRKKYFVSRKKFLYPKESFCVPQKSFYIPQKVSASPKKFVVTPKKFLYPPKKTFCTPKKVAPGCTSVVSPVFVLGMASPLVEDGRSVLWQGFSQFFGDLLLRHARRTGLRQTWCVSLNLCILTVEASSDWGFSRPFLRHPPKKKRQIG